AHHALPSFPTRRSSDLGPGVDDQVGASGLNLDRQRIVVGVRPEPLQADRTGVEEHVQVVVPQDDGAGVAEMPAGHVDARGRPASSEEHTSELQYDQTSY